MDDKQLKYLFPIISACFLIVGIILIVWPAQAISFACYILGGVMVAFGVIRIIAYFLQHEFAGFYRYSFVLGTAILLGGIFVLIKPDFVKNIFPTLLGVIIIIASLIKMQNSFDLYRMRYSAWWSVLAASLIGAVLGVVILMYPFATHLLLVRFIGIAMAVDAVMDFWTFGCIVHKCKQMDKAEQDAKKVVYETTATDAAPLDAADTTDNDNNANDTSIDL